jgi:Domain of unknown function DUF11
MTTLKLIQLLRLILIGLLMCLFFGQSAQANQVLNPFFTGTATAATSWTSSPGSIYSFFNNALSPTPPAAITAAGGATEFYSGCIGAPCLTFPFVVGTSSGAQQLIPTTIGTSYSLSFWTYHSGVGTVASPVELDVYWGTTLVYVGLNTSPAGWYLQTVNLGLATITSTALTILIRDDPNYSAITFIDVAPSVTNLRLTKTNPPNLAVAVPANYNLTITNGGSITSAASFTLLDQLPPNIQFNSSTSGAGLTGAACVPSGAIATGLLLTCTITSATGIAGGGTGSLTINVTPQAASAGVAGTNKASVPPSGIGVGVTASTCIGNDNPLGCAVPPAITPINVLGLTKSNPTSLVVGIAANYSLTVTNGSAVASSASFTLQDQLPPNIQFNSAAAGTGITSLTPCAATGTLAAGLLVTCTVNVTGGIPAGGTCSLTMNVTPQAASAAVAGINKASIPPSGVGAGVAPSTCTATGTPAGCAVATSITPTFISLAKSNPASFAVGVPANYSLTISNGGGIASSASFTLRDQLPPNIQYNSVAIVSGITSLTACATTGTLAAGLLLTCTVNVTGGILAGGTGSLTINVTPQAASAGVAGKNKASIPPSGTGAGVVAATCTTTGTPLGCAVAASITPSAAMLSVAKTATLICDPTNGISTQKNIPGAVVRWTVTVTNSGTTSVNLATITDLINFNTTPDANLITGAGGAAGCISATGTPESAAGKGFKLAISGTPVAPATTLRPAASYPKFFTTVADTDAASFGAGTVTIDYALGFPVEGVAPNAYTAGELKPGEVATFYFNVTVN